MLSLFNQFTIFRFLFIKQQVVYQAMEFVHFYDHAQCYIIRTMADGYQLNANKIALLLEENKLNVNVMFVTMILINVHRSNNFYLKPREKNKKGNRVPDTYY